VSGSGTANVERVHELTLPIETARLTLRPFTKTDFEDTFAYLSRADVVRYLYWEPATREGFSETLDRKIARTTLVPGGHGLNLAVVPRDVGRVVGDVSLWWQSEVHRGAEIGFVFHPDHQGRGYARESAQALLRLAFAELGLHRVTGRLDARNIASAGLLERLGMRREAHLIENEWVKGEWTDELMYAVLDREWEGSDHSSVRTSSSPSA